ncbi:nuclear transport factor 2 family protein [Gryllotalpicola koreensis]|uniref:Nuclear transport factor 2 family protein n=1 Tax=Gryllotalpicola koreensis TaxID=993086 RepID=A0ABP7ZR69_9MICO
MTSSNQLPEWFATALDAFGRGDLDGWMAIYAPDAVHEFPWVPEGRITRLEGWDAINAYMGRLVAAGAGGGGTFEVISVTETDDKLIVEMIGRRERDGVPVELGYVSVLTLRDGKVVRFRDYMNPLQLRR